MKKIIVLGTGGTISSDSRAGAGAVASISIADLLPTIADGRIIETRDLMTVGSFRLSLADMRRISEAARVAADDPEVDGVVITHGTDTMEETAYLTSLAHTIGTPIVFTGAQYAADDLSSDGPRNLRDAISFAMSPALRSAGVGIAFGGALLSARGTRKRHSTGPSPFDGGILLANMSGPLVAVHGVARLEPEPVVPREEFDKIIVDMVMSYPGADTEFLELAATRSRAIVLVGTGVGNAAPGFAECVAKVTESGIPVILASRVFEGPVTPVYGNGGGIDLVRAGAIPAGELSPQQARILSAALLASPSDEEEPFSSRFAKHAS